MRSYALVSLEFNERLQQGGGQIIGGCGFELHPRSLTSVFKVRLEHQQAVVRIKLRRQHTHDTLTRAID